MIFTCNSAVSVPPRVNMILPGFEVTMDQTVGRRSYQCLRHLDCNFQGHF